MSGRHEPIRHSASARNRRKAHHHAQNLVEESKYLAAEVAEAADRLVRLSLKIENRLRAETLKDSRP